MAEQLANLMKKLDGKKLVAYGSANNVACQPKDIVIFSRLKLANQTDGINGGTVLLNQEATGGYVINGQQSKVFLTIIEATGNSASAISVQSNFGSYAIFR